LRRRGLLRLSISAGSNPACSVIGGAFGPCLRRLVLRSISLPVSCEGRASFIGMKGLRARRSNRHRSSTEFPDRSLANNTQHNREER
jgi:hypothetical protein